MKRSARKDNTVNIITLISAILAVLCAIYTVVVFIVGSGTFSFVIWIFGTAFFAFLFFLSLKERYKKIPRVIRYIMYVLIAIGIVIFIVLQCLMLSHFSDRGEKDLDYVIVLGAQMNKNGPSAVFKYRLDAAYDYLIDNPNTICIISGGKGRSERKNEGDGSKEYLVSRGIDADRIIPENEAKDTDDNLRYSLELIRENGDDPDNITLGIITNNFHVFRGVHIAKKMTNAKIYGIAAKAAPLYLPSNMVRECLGILKDIPNMK